MTQCPINNNAYSFDSMDEFLKVIENYATEHGFTICDDMIIEGNSEMRLSTIKDIIECFGIANVYFDNVKGMVHRGIDEFYVDLAHVIKIP